VAHGSRDRRSQAALVQVAQMLQMLLLEKWGQALVTTGALEFGEVSLAERIQQSVELAKTQGYKNLRVVPIFLLPGKHVSEDLPLTLASACLMSDCDFPVHLCPYLGSHSGIEKLLANRMAEINVDRWILLAHGSRRLGGNYPVAQLAERLQALTAYWSTAPDLASRLPQLQAEGDRRIGIFPYFLFPGKIMETLSQQIQAYGQQFPELDLHLLRPLEPSTELVNLILDLIQPQRLELVNP
jgi:sirohydrochlorin cobaltochelatase